MERYNLSIEDWYLTQLLLLAQEGKSDYIVKYISLANIDLHETLIRLQEKGVILRAYEVPCKGEKFYPEDVEFNKNFLKNFYKCSNELGDELFKAYPYKLERGNSMYILNNITKGYNSLEDMYYDYGRIVQFNPSKHEHVMEILNYAKEHDLISFGIVEFIKSRKWETIEKMKEDGLVSNFDTIQSI